MSYGVKPPLKGGNHAAYFSMTGHDTLLHWLHWTCLIYPLILRVVLCHDRLVSGGVP